MRPSLVLSDKFALKKTKVNSKLRLRRASASVD